MKDDNLDRFMKYILIIKEEETRKNNIESSNDKEGKSNDDKKNKGDNISQRFV